MTNVCVFTWEGDTDKDKDIYHLRPCPEIRRSNRKNYHSTTANTCTLNIWVRPGPMFEEGQFVQPTANDAFALGQLDAKWGADVFSNHRMVCTIYQIH